MVEMKSPAEFIVLVERHLESIKQVYGNVRKVRLDIVREIATLTEQCMALAETDSKSFCDFDKEHGDFLRALEKGKR